MNWYARWFWITQADMQSALRNEAQLVGGATASEEFMIVQECALGTAS